jgi:hypothetical protein
MRSAGRSFGDVIEVTDFITKTMGTPGNFAQSIRDVMIPVVSKLAPFQTGFVQTLSELAVAYHGSPVVEWAGERCFDESFRGGRGIGGRFVLFVGADADSVTTAQAQHVAEDFQAVLELRTGRQQGFTLVRPDSYTAYESQAGPAPRALQAIRELLQRQTIGSSGVDHDDESLYLSLA